MSLPITEHVVKTPRHTSFHLACGAPDATPIVFVHGWPELSISWRHQLRCFADLGFRAIAPDMRGYGRSTVHPRHGDYAIEHAVQDMLELLDALGHERAIWVGHDWGTPVVWALASHHPERCHGVAGLCVPYFPDGFAPASVAAYVDRALYAEDSFPFGQWDYQLFYAENFEKATATFDADPVASVKILFRKGLPGDRGKPSPLASIRRAGGWFGGAPRAPDVPVDRDLLTDEDLHRYASALAANGFFGPDSWYLNGDANVAYAARARDGGRLGLPVLFFHAEHDYVCDTVGSRLAEPMRAHCADLTEVSVSCGHWMAQEKPAHVNAGLARWLALKFPGLWRA